MTHKNKHICAGIIISPKAVLTSAHSFYRRNRLYSLINIHVGASNLTDAGLVHSIKNIFIHPDFVGHPSGRNGQHSDIAIAIVCTLLYTI
jgi:V8-like Glu-specific endopeptidase